MAIVKLKKVSIYGLARQRDQVLQQLQYLGCLHLIDLRHPDKQTAAVSTTRQQVFEAVKYLAASPVQNSNQHARYADGQDFATVTEQILELRRRRATLSDEHDYLLRSIQIAEPWGDFSVPDSHELGLLKLWFYALLKHQVDQLLASGLTWQMVNQNEQFSYVVVVNPTEPISMPAKPIELDPRPLSELKRRVEQVAEQLDALHWERVALTRWTKLLTNDLNDAEDESARLLAIGRLKQDESLFALQAWAPENTLSALQDFCDNQDLALTVENPSHLEEPPTLLRNPQAVAGAEGAVTFYMTPAYQAWDPTWVMYFSFTFFFAMIMSDAAYGLILGGLLLLFWKRLSAHEKTRGLRYLMLAIVLGCVFYGLAVGSFFGMTPNIFKPFQLQLDGRPLIENHNAMMIIALTIGVLHLTLANLITAQRYWGRAQAFSSLGWAAVLVSGLVFGLTRGGPNRVVAWLADRLGQSVTSLQPVINQGAQAALSVGLVAVLLFSSSRPLFSLRLSDWLWRLLEGLQGLTNISKAFGDSLSYLRLFALGLASAQLAATFNSLASGALDIPGLGVLLAALILVMGHTINLLLGIMSGLVHGLRLNCIEFFNWSLTEEGYPFQAFSKKAG